MPTVTPLLSSVNLRLFPLGREAVQTIQSQGAWTCWTMRPQIPSPREGPHYLPDKVTLQPGPRCSGEN